MIHSTPSDGTTFAASAIPWAYILRIDFLVSTADVLLESWKVNIRYLRVSSIISV